MENNRVIAYDLGTGGLKASLYDFQGESLCSTFVSYETFYQGNDIIEQRPEDWWNAICEATKELLKESGTEPKTIKALAISGHSLGVVPLDQNGRLLREKTPIWSDSRAKEQAQKFFETTKYENWYNTTGCGFPAACYPIFKLMWYKQHEEELYNQAKTFIGTKDYCNYRFSGQIRTDYSYASGTGAFDLKLWNYNQDFIEKANLRKELFPQIAHSSEVIGYVTSEAAVECGLCQGTAVVCGGVDNSCMALGAAGIESGRTYTSLGSSAWVALIGDKPTLDFDKKPYVFAHVIKGLYTSATAIFSAGTSFKWVCDNFFADLKKEDTNIYNSVIELARTANEGSLGVLFNPSLAGGSMIEPSQYMSGAFTGIRLGTTRAEIARATLEGISMNLRIALDILRAHHQPQKMLMVGGGAKNHYWLQMFADIYDITTYKTAIDQQAASLGAAALALNGIGAWNGYQKIDTLQVAEATFEPDTKKVEFYNKHLQKFKTLSGLLAQLAEAERAL